MDCVTSMRRYQRKKEREELGRTEESLESESPGLPYRNMEMDTRDMFNVPQPIKGIRKTIGISIEAEQEVIS